MYITIALSTAFVFHLNSVVESTAEKDPMTVTLGIVPIAFQFIFYGRLTSWHWFAVLLPTNTEPTFVFLFVLILLILLTDGFNGNSKDHHTLLLFLMMTASDLSDQTKNWEGTRRTAVS